MHKLALFKIDSLARSVFGEEAFPIDKLPMQIGCGIQLEDLSSVISSSTFSWMGSALSQDQLELLESTRFALTHHYEGSSLSDADDQRAHKLIETAAACLRIVRPMRESVYLIRGSFPAGGLLRAEHVTHPRKILEIPEVQKLFALRLRDIEELAEILPRFVKIMSDGDEVIKFRMAVEFNQAAHFQDHYWKARFLLRCSALESLFTTERWEHKGSLVATERIKFFLGHARCIYDDGDIPDYLPQPKITVSDIVGDVYKIRNHIAHGNRIPGSFTKGLREGVNGSVPVTAVADEALSFFVRKSLVKIMQESLEGSFRDSKSCESFFTGQGLTRSALMALRERPIERRDTANGGQS